MHNKKFSWLISCLCISLAALLVACNSAQIQGQSTPAADAAAVAGAESPVAKAQLPQLQGKAMVVLQVNGQPITIEVDGNEAPITAGNFVDLVNRGVYNGTSFHRVIRQPQPFVAQGGDPQSKDPAVPVAQLGTGSYIDPATAQPRYIPLEIKPQGATEPLYSQTLRTAGVTSPPQLRHRRGAVAMARSPLPDSASAQFYIALDELNFLDGDYAVFGYVTEGMEVVDQIQQGDRIQSGQVIQGLENLKTPAGVNPAAAS